MFIRHTAVPVLMIQSVVFAGLAPAVQPPETFRNYQLTRAGQSMSAAQAAKLEEHLAKSPDDLDARIKMLGYCWMNRYADAMHARHILWIIENRPESAIAEGPEVVLNGNFDAPAYRRGAELWQAHAAKENATTTILSHAANYFTLSEPDFAERYLKRCSELEPDNSKWFAELGHLYRLSKSGKAFEAFETALTKTADRKRYYLLSDLAKAAIDAGKFEKAKKYAVMLLESSVERPGGGWNYGNAVHHGNLVLGHVALHDDQLAEAEAYLLRAGKTPGSPQLNSFGPNMSLALALLKRDRSNAVIEYLKLCGKFWKKSTTDAWIKEIEEGRTPIFGGNLRY